MVGCIPTNQRELLLLGLIALLEEDLVIHLKIEILRSAKGRDYKHFLIISYLAEIRDITRLIGNSAPPLLIEKIARAMAGHLQRDSKRDYQSLLRGISTSNRSPRVNHKIQHQVTETPKTAKSAKSHHRNIKQRKAKYRSLPLLEASRTDLIVESIEKTSLTTSTVVKSIQVERNPKVATLLPISPAQSSHYIGGRTNESLVSPLLRVFLCHSSKDKPTVRTLYHRLREDGIAPWLDEEDLLPGQNWQMEIPKAVQSSDVVIICLSRDSI